MDHVELKPYPMPEGMAIPRLMPFQDYPWNGDGYLAAEVLRLKHVHGLTSAHETGTCLGSTTLWLSHNFNFAVSSCEVNADCLSIAKERMRLAGKTRPFVEMVLQDSRSHHVMDIDGCGDRTLCFLDAHWGQHCPLLDELALIASQGIKPCIIIHDFQVPGTDFGFDRMPDGRPFNLDLIRDHLDRIYGTLGWRHNYPTKVEGAARGWISIEPA